MKRIAKSTLAAVGLDVRLSRNVAQSQVAAWQQKQDALWAPFLKHLDIRTIIDVGANTGQFAELIHRHCPDANIIAFEPLPVCHADLRRALAEFPDSQLISSAVGNAPATAEMNASQFTPCSSLLAGTDLLGEDYPDAAVTETIEVPVVRIDDALQSLPLLDDVLVKFDVQGFEIPAMEGAAETLAKARVVVCEVCFFRRLYQGQPLFDEIYAKLKDLGFTYMGNAEQHKRKSDGRIVEADAIFERLGA
ncbi:2-O-methyltransferase NoeI [Stieleria neptunia]|uniref:2-O-methyltransferase NoeI n=1 Tax=Stieleria neptunia TaxID=2527979 RepID=A0A518HQL1_9BACT|nr:FkbM family methyltransferase [Stieleria neptunia]QDV43143.1 2-O-methyltransferase NoeI [Stieleria neptunia]